MAYNGYVSSHHNHADEYIGSALPFVTGSLKLTTTPIKIEFPYVTRWIVVTNTGDALDVIRVGFTKNGVNANPVSFSNYFHMSGSESGGVTARLEVKTKQIFLRTEAGTGTASIMAGYTTIPVRNFPDLTGSAGFQGVG